jgi:predicted nucleic acid-binding protein
VLVYVDSSVLARAYLSDEKGHAAARELLEGTEHLLVTATWTIVEVTSALVRATRAGRLGDIDRLLAVLAADVGEDGPITVLRGEPGRVEERATEVVRQHGLRSLDALHLAVADLVARPLAQPGESLGFASRDDAQRAAAEAIGFVVISS